MHCTAFITIAVNVKEHFNVTACVKVIHVVGMCVVKLSFWSPW